MNPQHARLALDGAAMSTIVSVWTGWMHPALEALLLILSVTWLVIQVGGWAIKKWRK
jgi:hypothetical protein